MYLDVDEEASFLDVFGDMNVTAGAIASRFLLSGRLVIQNLMLTVHR